MHSQNRLALPSMLDTSLMGNAFLKLKELQLNATLTTWHECRVVMTYMPALQLLEMGYNRIGDLNIKASTSSETSASALTDNDTLRTINFDGNQLRSWARVCEAIQPIHGCVHIHRFSRLGSYRLDASDRSSVQP